MNSQSSAFAGPGLGCDDKTNAGPHALAKDKVGDAIPWAIRSLREAGVVRAEGEALHLLEKATGLSRAHLIAFPETLLSSTQMEKFQTLIRRRAERVPAAYLTGRAPFLRWEFFVDERVMVPRPETEILAEVLAHSIQGREEGWVVDVGTGSGVIGVSLALMLPGIRVLAADISQGALEVARENIALHKCEGRAFPVCGDLLAPLGVAQTFRSATATGWAGLAYSAEVATSATKAGKPCATEGNRVGVVAIVANMPYIPSDVLPTLEPEVAKHEPRVALDGGVDGLRLITPLAAKAPDYLAQGGMVAMEVGQGQARQVETLLRGHPRMRRTEVIRDYAGIERVVMGFVDS